MRSALDARRIVVLGYVVRGPLGGLAWHHLQYVLGLAGLGHDVWFAEDSDDYPSCYDPARDETGTDPTHGLEFARDAFARLGLGSRWAYHDAHTARWLGPAGNRMVGVCRSADVVLDLSGVNPVRPWWEQVPLRILVDTDPVFTQVRHRTDAEAHQRALAHDAFFSFGEGIGRGTATVPDDGLPWSPTRQPVVLDAWRVTPGPPDGSFTTVMNWDSYAEQVHDGRRYGMKSASFRGYLDLPSRTAETLELAVGGRGTPHEELRAAGWRVRDPRHPTRDPWKYQRYVRSSKAELSVAKHGYVAARTGWFSERSAGYLASGRPVVVEDTGFSDWLDCGLGVVTFRDADEAVAGLEDVAARYEQHCAAARELVAEHFDARRVLTDLLSAAEVSR